MDLAELTICEARSAMVGGQLSAADYARALIDAASRWRNLNSFVSRRDAELVAEAERCDRDGTARDPKLALAGIPLGIKDNINTRVLPTSGATVALKDFVAGADAPVAAPLWREGALLAGKTNMHEIAFGLTSNNYVTGPCRNPYDPRMIAGGSSGGSAAAVAARLVPAALGTDTSCSIRLPAALCGVFGFRPSIGRYPNDGILPISHTRDTAGPMARAMEDIRLLDAVITGGRADTAMPSLKGLRIGVARDAFFRNLDDDVAGIVSTRMTELARQGVIWVEGDLPEMHELIAASGFPISLYETVFDIPAYLKRYGAPATLAKIADTVGSPWVARYLRPLLGDGAIPEAVYRQGLAAREQLQQRAAEFFAAHQVDALIFPAAPLAARPVGEDETVSINGKAFPTDVIYQQNSELCSVAGLPGLTLPAALTPGGLPVSLEVNGPMGSDLRLLAIGATLAAALPKLPPPKRPPASANV